MGVVVWGKLSDGLLSRGGGGGVVDLEGGCHRG